VNPPVPVVCTATCQSFTLTAATSMPFLVAVKDATASTNNGWDLYVYSPAGALVGAANGVGANGQAIAVDPATPGTYQIVVTFTYAEDPGAHYTGEARLMATSSWAPPRPTCGIAVGGVHGCFDLPQLRAVPASDLHVDGLPPVASTPVGFPLPATVPTSSSCYADESLGLAHPSPDGLQHPAQRCLRFTTNVQNVGAGTFDIRIPWAAASGTSGFLPGGCQATQAVTRHNGGGGTVMRPAGACEFHPAHAHFHYRDLVAFSLHRVAAAGGVGPQVGTALKESFCLGDDDYFGFATPGPNGPRNYVGQPGCNVPAQVSAGSVDVEEGVTPGWGDVYTWDVPDQFIDVTGLAAGDYDLVEETNPGGAILVSGPARTCSLTRLHLTDTAVSIIGTQASIACP
jgi:hypothetical protein